MSFSTLNSPLPIERRGMMLVISSPSGAGKTSLTRALIAKDERLALSISVTTRPPRPGEVQGRDYFFVSPQAFAQLQEEDAFLEDAHIFGHNYGTPRAWVEEQLAAGQDVIFDIDWQGTQQLLAEAPQDVVTIFILPPSMAELHNRLQKRAQDRPAVIAERMRGAAGEISHWAEYTYVILNEDFDQSLAQLHTIVGAERLKRRRRIGLTQFVRGLLSGQAPLQPSS